MFKDLTKVKGEYVIRSLRADDRSKAQGTIYIGYEISLVTVAQAWKFKTRKAAEKAIKDADLDSNTVMVVMK